MFPRDEWPVEGKVRVVIYSYIKMIIVMVTICMANTEVWVKQAVRCSGWRWRDGGYAMISRERSIVMMITMMCMVPMVTIVMMMMMKVCFEITSVQIWLRSRFLQV